jgi:hypothetical protein
MNKIDGVTILGLEIKLYGEIQEDNQIDLGALTLRNGGREYILDTVQSNSRSWRRMKKFSLTANMI